MIGLDTSVLVRYITQDDPVESPQANSLIEILNEQCKGFVTTTVLVELCWVLEHAYKVDRDRLFNVLESLVRSRELMIEDSDVVNRALRRYYTATCGFADCLILEQAREYGCESTMTFDRDATSAGMTLV